MLCSVIMLTYNSSLEKIYLTLNSVLRQENLDKIEVIVADDGSKNNFFSEIKQFLKKHGVINYKLITSDKNRGTVENFYSGVRIAKGRYIKGLGCGDLLYGKDSIIRFCMFMEEKNQKIGFGLMRAFQTENNHLEYCDCTIPMDIKAFRENNLKKVKRNIVSRGKLMSGASMLFEKDLLTKLLDEIRGKVIFCEDFIQIIALIKNIDIGFFDEYIMWYEMGVGISTSGNSFWKVRIQKDYNSLITYLGQEYKNNKYVRRRLRTQRLDNWPKLFRWGMKFLIDIGMFFIPMKTGLQKRQGLYKAKNEHGFLNDTEFLDSNRLSHKE